MTTPSNWVRRWSRYTIAWAALALPAQQSPTDSGVVFRTETQLAEVEVRVVDKRGDPIADLEQSDFVVKEDGKEQSIATFEFVTLDTQLTEPDGPEREQADNNAAPAPDGAQASATELRLCLLTEAAPGEERLIHQAIRSFLDDPRYAGIPVSLGGQPFTADRVQLRATLEQMRAAPFGGRHPETNQWVEGLIEPARIEIARLESSRLATVRDAVEQELSGTAEKGQTGGTLADRLSQSNSAANKNPNHPNTEMRPPRIRGIDQQLEALYRRTLTSYRTIIRRLASYPGKKAVVLFRSGLRIDQNNTPLTEAISAEALRHRVSFYAMNTRGLGTMAISAAESVNPERLLGGDPERQNFANESLRRRRGEVHGLQTLAEMTGGQAVVHSNRFTDVFDRVRQDSSNYYLLGYYPSTKREQGRFHGISVDVKRRGAKVEAARGYYESKSFEQMSANEKEVFFQGVIQDGRARGDFSLRGGQDFFRADSEEAAVLFGVSAPMGELMTDSKNGNTVMKFSVGIHAVDLNDGSSWTFRSPTREYTFAPGQLEKQRMGEETFIDYTERVYLPPGKYRWRATLLNELTGAYGVREEEIHVPGFAEPAAASSLLLASQGADPVAGNDETEQAQPPDSVLAFKTMHFVPEYRQEFVQGQPIFILYDVYSVPEEGTAERPLTRVELTRDGKPYNAYRGSVDVLSDPTLNRIRHLVGIDTRDLPIDSYTVTVHRNAREDGPATVLSEEFKLLPR